MPFLPPFPLKGVTFFMPAIVSITQAGAQLVCYEGFSGYAAGAQVESGANGSSGDGLDGGAGWGGPYDVSNAIKSLVRIENRSSGPVNYANGEIFIPGGNRALRFYDIANGSYAVRRPLGTVFDATAGDDFWFSVLFRTTSASPLDNQDFFQLGFDDNPAAVSGSPRVSIGANTGSADFPAAFRFFVRSTTAPDASVFCDDIDILAANTYLLVGRIRPEAGLYDTVSLFVNPSTLDHPGSPSASITLPSGLAALSHAFIRTVGLDSGDAYVLDEWHIGRDYGSVVQSLRGALRILPADQPGGSPVLRWPVSLTGAVLETSTGLTSEPWSEIAGPFAPAGADHQYPIPIDPGTPRRFYRLRR